MKFANLDEWLACLESRHPKKIDLGLDRVRRVAERMELLGQAATVVTVAGTNGKGSFVKTLSTLLLADDARVGCYTSPHLIHYNERITVNGQNATDRAICEAFEAIEEARDDISLSYFEFGTLAALYVFKAAKLDYIILEVGLGGRLDAVNIVDADISVITSIGIDHEDWLGSDREDIGLEKAGILRYGQPFICVDDAIPHSIKARAEELACKAYWLGEQIHIDQSSSATLVACQLPASETKSISDATVITQTKVAREKIQFQFAESYVPLPSIAAALQCYCLLRDSNNTENTEKISSLVQSVRLEGRYETLASDGYRFILDVAHNPQAAEHLAATLTSRGNCDLIAIFACMQDKNLAGIVEPLLPLIRHWVCVDIPGMDRSRSGEQLAEDICKLGGSAQSEITPELGLEGAKRVKASTDQTILVFGSFYLLAEIKPLLEES